MDNVNDRIRELSGRIEELEKAAPLDKLSMIVFSGSLDKLIAAFIIATGAAAMGSKVSMFFTFWGTAALRKKARVKKDFISRMFGFMLPTGFGQLKLSKMNMAGAGTAMMKSLMRKKKTVNLPELLVIAEQLGVRIFICEMSMDLMGISRKEIVDYAHLDYCGVAGFLSESHESSQTIFI